MTNTCPRCGTASDEGWADGVCPACVLEFGLRGYETAPQEDGEPKSAKSEGLTSAGRSFGDYELLEEIGSGGMGVVYRALQISLNRIVAVKRIRGGLLARDKDIQRFRAEAETAAKLQHPNIVAIHEVGGDAGQPFFSMDFVEGRSLAEIVREAPLSPAKASSCARTLAEAIHYAHLRGVLHRDLKPSNVMLDARGEPHVLDFGLAKVLEADTDPTLSGTVMGSPSYMPPEQALGKPADTRGDVYALGAILYETLTGHAPFRAASPLETLKLVTEQEPAPPRVLNPKLPRDLETICLKCLAKSPAARYATAQELADELGRFLSGQPILARPVGPVARLLLWSRRKPGVAALAAALALALIFGFAGVSFEWRREFRQRLRAEEGELRARQNLYAADMKLAQEAAESGNDGRARALLEPYDPAAKRTRASVFQRSGDANPAPDEADATSRIDLRGFEWRYLWHATLGDPHRLLTGHASTVSGLALSKDGTTLYSAGFDGVVRAQPLTPGSAEDWSQRFDFHASSLAIHPQGRLIAVGGDQGHQGVIIDLESHQTRPLTPNFLQQVTFSPDGRWLLCGSIEGWSSSTGSMAIMNLRGEVAGALPEAGGHAVFSPDGKLLATGPWNGKIKLWTWPEPLENGVPTPQPHGEFSPAGSVTMMAFSLDGSRLVSGNSTGELRLWNVATGLLLAHTARDTAGDLLAAAFSPDGRLIAIGGHDSVIRVCDSETLAQRWTHRGHTSGVWRIVWSEDGQSLISGGAEGSIRIWPAQPPPPRELILTNIFADFNYCAMAFSPDSRWLSAALTGGAIGLWNARTGDLTNQLPLGDSHLRAAFSPDSKELVISFGHAEVRRFTVPELRESSRGTLENVGLKGVGAALSEDGRWLAGISAAPAADGAIHLWDTRTGRHAATLRGHTGRVLGLRFSADHRWLASGSFDKTARLWDLTTFREAAVLRGADNGVTTLSFAPDGRTLAAGSWDGVARLWRVPSGQPIGELPHYDNVPVPEFLPDGRTLSVMTQSAGIRLFNLDTQRDTCVLRWRPYRYVRCSPDGQMIAVYSQDGRIKLWPAPRGEP